MPKLSRREVLKGAAASAALIPLGYLVGVTFGGYPYREGLVFLSSKEAAIVESLGEVVIPNENPIGINTRQIDVAARVDEFVAIMPRQTQSRVRLLLWTVEHVFPIRMPYFFKFTDLSLESRRKVLERFEKSGGVAERALARALKGLIEMVYYNDPRVSEKIGFVGKCNG